MKRLSWGKNRFLRNSKGFSSIIGSVFVLMIVMLSSIVLLTILNQNTRFQLGTDEVNAMDLARESESIVITDVVFSVTGDQVNVSCLVTNTGNSAIELVTLWIVDSTIQDHGYRDALSIALKSGEKISLTGVDLLSVTIAGTGGTHDFTGWFMTSRGNVFPLVIDEAEHGEGVSEFIESQDWLDLGYLRFHFRVESINFTSSTYRTPMPGWVVPGKTDILLHIELQNVYDTPIYIDEDSLLHFQLQENTGDGGNTQKSWTFFVVGPASTFPGDLQSYDENDPLKRYVLQPNAEGKHWLGGPPVTLKFGSEYRGDNDPIGFNIDDANSYLSQMGIYYHYYEESSEVSMGQTVPFAAIRSEYPFSP